jgi:hypothetical protein
VNPVNSIAHLAALVAGMPCPQIAEFIHVVENSSSATQLLKDLVAGRLGYFPAISTIRAAIQAVLDNDALTPQQWHALQRALANLGLISESAQASGNPTASSTKPRSDAYREFRNDNLEFTEPTAREARHD